MSDKQIGHILSSTPPIVEHILKNFCVPELNTCAQVCKLWNSIAQVIKKRRHQLFWLFKVNPTRVSVDANPELHDSVLHPPMYCDYPSELGTYFYDIIDEAPSDPKFGLIFCSDKIYTKPQRYFLDYSPPKTKRKRKAQKVIHGTSLDKRKRPFYNDSMMDYLAVSLPSHCKTVLCSASGIVGSPTNGTRPLESELFPGVAGIFFPNIPGADIYTFPIYETSDSSASPDFSEITGIPKGKEVKCLLIFLREIPEHSGLVCQIINHYLQSQNNNLAIGGAAVEYFACPVSSERCLDAIGVAFTGDNVQAASIILEPSIRTAKAAENQLKQLQNCGFQPGQRCAFMFACNGRGTDFYHEGNVEADAFHKVFPSVPLFGLFGNGEIGNNYLPNSPTKIKVKMPKSNRRGKEILPWFHGFTTIFVLLSMQKIKT